jgi:hypothetical protein
MRHSLLQKTLLQTIRNPGNANLFDGRRWSIRATAKTSTQYTHAYTENILCFGGRSAQRRYRGVASSLPRYVVADQARKGVRESQSTFAISDIRHTGARISTLAVGLGEFYKSWNKASLSEAFLSRITFKETEHLGLQTALSRRGALQVDQSERLASEIQPIVAAGIETAE